MGLSINSKALKGEFVADFETSIRNEPFQSNGTEAGMEGGEFLDKGSADEEILIKRLIQTLGKEGPEGMNKKGPLWRTFIRGSKDTGDDPTTAEVVRDALNELLYRERIGKSVGSKAKFVYSLAQAYAAERGWAYCYKPDGKGAWMKVAPFNWWERKNAAGRRK